MNFPRYIKREGRDYFYLTLRYVLPGEPMASHGRRRRPTTHASRPVRAIAELAPAAVVAVALAFGTRARNAQYASEEGMWRHVIAQRPDNPRAKPNPRASPALLGTTPRTIGKGQSRIPPHRLRFARRRPSARAAAS